MAPFDPYHHWLGIPPHEQPPTHYRLLGVPLFESNADVIVQAADRQMYHVQCFGAGQYAEASQQLLRELAAARDCLLDSQQKVQYDQQLELTLADRSERVVAAAPPPPGMPYPAGAFPGAAPAGVGGFPPSDPMPLVNPSLEALPGFAPPPGAYPAAEPCPVGPPPMPMAQAMPMPGSVPYVGSFPGMGPVQGTTPMAVPLPTASPLPVAAAIPIAVPLPAGPPMGPQPVPGAVAAGGGNGAAALPSAELAPVAESPLEAIRSETLASRASLHRRRLQKQQKNLSKEIVTAGVVLGVIVLMLLVWLMVSGSNPEKKGWSHLTPDGSSEPPRWQPPTDKDLKKDTKKDATKAGGKTRRDDRIERPRLYDRGKHGARPRTLDPRYSESRSSDATSPSRFRTPAPAPAEDEGETIVAPVFKEPPPAHNFPFQQGRPNPENGYKPTMRDGAPPAQDDGEAARDAAVGRTVPLKNE